MKLYFIYILFFITFGASSLWANNYQKKQVVVLLSNDSSIYEETLAGIQNTLRAHIQVEYLNALEESENLSETLKQIDDPKNYSAIISLGEPASRVAYQKIKNIPVLFTMVAAPRNLDITLEKLCGISVHIPVSAYFKTFKTIHPESKYFYTFYLSKKTSFLAKEGEYMDHNFGAIYNSRRIKNPASLQATLEDLKGKIDAIHIIPDPLFNEKRFSMVSEFSKKNKVLLASNFEELVRFGATFAYSPNYDFLGTKTANMANRIISNQSDCKQEGIKNFPASSFFFYLNEEYAKQSGIVIPENLKQRALLVKQFKGGVKLINAKKWKAAHIVFKEIRKKDSENTVVHQYLKFVIHKLTGAQTSKLLLQAKNHLKNGNLVAVNKIYGQILRINPHSKEAQTGLIQLSKHEQRRAKELKRKGQLFEAFQFYKRSLKSNSKNTGSQKELIQLRNRLKSQIPSLLTKGQKSYNSRNYAKAITLFKKVLLVSPGNKIAKEYYRLSKKKKEAFGRLRHQ